MIGELDWAVQAGFSWGKCRLPPFGVDDHHFYYSVTVVLCIFMPPVVGLSPIMDIDFFIYVTCVLCTQRKDSVDS